MMSARKNDADDAVMNRMSAGKSERADATKKTMSAMKKTMKKDDDRAALSIDDRAALGLGCWASSAPLKRDVFAVAKRALSQEAQLPLFDDKTVSERIAGSLPLTVRLSAGPYTPRSFSLVSRGSLSGLLSWAMAILTPPATLPSRGSLARAFACLSLLPAPSHRSDPGALGTTCPHPPPPPSGGGNMPSLTGSHHPHRHMSERHMPFLLRTHRPHHYMSKTAGTCPHSPVLIGTHHRGQLLMRQHSSSLIKEAAVNVR